jgi:hypothetical protein
MEFKALFVLVLIFLSCVSVNAEINPSVESQPFFCRYSITDWTPLCAQGGAGTQGPPGTPGTGNNTFYYNSTTNTTYTYSNTTSFFNTTIGNNLTTFSNYTYWYITNITQSEMNQTPGPQGPQGIQGPQGVNGTPGINGTPGAQGIQGIQGVNGTPGAQGIQGEKGDKGDKGDQGDPGPTGPPGLANMTAGPQGPQGVNGTPGVDGAMGPQGIQGIQGVNGTPGAPGVQGERGGDGIQGEKGEPGTNGLNNMTANMTAGPQGATGSTGSTGPAGLDANVSTIYPVSSVYGSTRTTNPNTLLGAGTWSSLYNTTITTAYSNTFTETMTANNAPALSLINCSSIFSGSYDCYKAFNHNLADSGWVSSAATTGWIRYYNTTPRIVTNYTMWPRADGLSNTPTSWKLNASTDGSAWTTIDTQSGIAWASTSPKSFPIPNNNSYTYYNFTISAVGGGGNVGITELYLYDDSASRKTINYWERTA